MRSAFDFQLLKIINERRRFTIFHAVERFLLTKTSSEFIQRKTCWWIDKFGESKFNRAVDRFRDCSEYCSIKNDPTNEWVNMNEKSKQFIHTLERVIMNILLLFKLTEDQIFFSKNLLLKTSKSHGLKTDFQDFLSNIVSIFVMFRKRWNHQRMSISFKIINLKMFVIHLRQKIKIINGTIWITIQRSVYLILAKWFVQANFFYWFTVHEMFNFHYSNETILQLSVEAMDIR